MKTLVKTDAKKKKNRNAVTAPGIRKNNTNGKEKQKKKNRSCTQDSRREEEVLEQHSSLRSECRPKNVRNSRQENDFGESSSKTKSVIDKMRSKLFGGRFRMLNEVLYTCKGDEAVEYFEKDPAAFQLYHTGYQEQMSKWPKQPIEVIVEWLNSQNPNYIVADFGCGDAKLAKSVRNKVYSLDLVSCDSSVIACNMASTPLSALSVNVAVFCLSLMGTDYPNYLKEAERVLKPNGWVLIAEVKSRFDVANGGGNPVNFVNGLSSLGFHLVKQDDTNKMFLMFYFQKKQVSAKAKKKGREFSWPILKPCLYKRR